MATYYVSGIVQIKVRAKSAEVAVQRAQELADGLMRHRNTVTVNLDNISTDELAGVGLEDAANLDAEAPK